MKNFRANGASFTATLTAPVASGGVVVMSDMLGVAYTAGLVGQNVAVATEGVFALPKLAGAALAQGKKVYYDAAAGTVSATVGAGLLAGFVYEAAAAGDTTVNVKLNGPC